MNKYTQGNWYVNGSDDVWIGDRICIYVGDENDARLIAAAPDLFAFVQVVADLVIVPPMMTEQARQIMWLQDMAKAAIAKATGEKHD